MLFLLPEIMQQHFSTSNFRTLFVSGVSYRSELSAIAFYMIDGRFWPSGGKCIWLFSEQLNCIMYESVWKQRSLP